MNSIAGLLIRGKQYNDGINGDQIITKMIKGASSQDIGSIEIKEVEKGKLWFALCNSNKKVHQISNKGSQIYTNQSLQVELLFDGKLNMILEKSQLLKNLKLKNENISDEELITELIARLGVNSFSNLDGIFSLASFDRLRNQLIIARDRFGHKPLYYINSQDIFAFATNLASLLTLKDFLKMEISLKALSQFMITKFVQSPYTVVEPIRKMDPGQFGILNSSGTLKLDRFFHVTNTGSISIEEDAGDINLLKNKSVQNIDLILRNSVFNTISTNSQILLDGGFDSALIGSYIFDYDSNKMHQADKRIAYSVQFADQQDESIEYNKNICTNYNWQHKTVQISSEDLISAYLDLSKHMEEPIGDINILLDYNLMKKIKENSAEQIISSVGARELFAGHKRYFSFANKFRSDKNINDWYSYYLWNQFNVGNQTAISKADIKFSIDSMKDNCRNFKILQHYLNNDPLSYLQWIDIYTSLSGNNISSLQRSTREWSIDIQLPLLNTRVFLYVMKLQHCLVNSEQSLKQIINELLLSKAVNIPRPIRKIDRIRLSADDRFGLFIVDRIRNNLKTINLSNDAMVCEWLKIYIESTDTWSQEGLIALSIYLDWLGNIMEKHSKLI